MSRVRFNNRAARRNCLLGKQPNAAMQEEGDGVVFLDENLADCKVRRNFD